MIDNYLKSQSPAADRPVLFHPNTYPEQAALLPLDRQSRQRLKLHVPGSEGSGGGWLMEPHALVARKVWCVVLQPLFVAQRLWSL